MKPRSITVRLTLQIMALILCFSAMILAANTLLIRPLYESSIQANMLEAMDQLREADYTSGSTEWIDQIESISRGKAFDVTIDLKGQTLYSSSKEFGLRAPVGRVPGDLDPVEPRERPEISFNVEGEWEELEGGVRMGHVIEPRNNTELYLCNLTLDNGIEIHLTQPAEPILESIQQANILLLGGTVFFLMVASMLAFRMARSFTWPIRQMQAHVGKLAHLDFSGNVEVTTGDELEELGRDINGLSRSLEDTLASLEEKNDQLAREIRSQKRLISDASHELRTPLTLIQGYADEIAGGYVTDPDRQREYVGYIAQESTKMKRLINEILELSRLESGRMTLNREVVNVREAVITFFDKYEGFMEEQGMALELDLDDQECMIDCMRFEQILANFLSNAAKYGDGSRPIRLWTEALEDRVRIHFYNAGQAIPEDIMDDLWRGFYKADEARSSDDKSFGLGLSIVKGIQETAHLGYGVYNADGGVTFWFEVDKVQLIRD